MNTCLEFRDNKPEKFMICASKAAEIVSNQLCNCKEYTDAAKFLKNVSLVIAEKLGSHYVPPASKEELDESKVLQDNFYSFQYRKMLAQYHVYFFDFKNAEDQLRNLLEDELVYYGFVEKPKAKEEAKEDAKADDEDAKKDKKEESP